MTINKFAHSCILVEEAGARILFDPGHYSTEQNELIDLDAILITHVHGDHCDVASIKVIAAKNPGVKIFTNVQVQEALKAEGIESELLGDGQSTAVKGVTIEGFGTDHAEIHSSRPIDRNTGYLVGGRFFHPGDSYTIPSKPVEILALPTGGPWLKIGEAIDFALAVKPKAVIPMHDGMFLESARPAKWIAIVQEQGIEVRSLELGQLADY